MGRAFSRFGLLVAGLVIAAGIVAAVVVAADRMVASEHDAARRNLLARDADLNRAELAPGSVLACLDAGAGEAVENACEKAVFHSAQSAAAAVAYMSARLTLLSEAAGLAAHGDGGVAAALAASRRAVELDRYGIAAHVLATRDSCTAAKCPAFALVEDASVLKANLESRVYDQYVSRYVDKWNEAAPQPKTPAVSEAAPVPPLASIAPTTGGPMPAPIKPGEKWDFPSAASIPAVSIMNKEPPPGAAASAQAPPASPQAAVAQPPSVTTSKTAPTLAIRAAPIPPLPPKRPPPQAAPELAPAR
jgi:hypothetical protein